MTLKALVLSALLVVAGVAPAAATTTQSESYEGAHISFETKENAVVDYRVAEQTLFEEVNVQSQRNANVAAGVSLAAVTKLNAAGLAVASQSDASATVSVESGAEMAAHDNNRGILTIGAQDGPQYVTVNLASTAQATQESDSKVAVTGTDGVNGVFLVVGDGAVTVNNNGDISADLKEGSKLVYRNYQGERTEDDKSQERLIQDGTAAAEVYVMQQGDQTVTDVVQYSENTTVEVTKQSDGVVEMTADRAESEGTVIITSVSEEVLAASDELQVTVDGDAAAKASSYSDLTGAIGGDTSKYMLSQSSSAEASANVLVAVNHFSERKVTMQSGGDGNTGASGPGFGVLSALAALGLLLLGRTRL